MASLPKPEVYITSNNKVKKWLFFLSAGIVSLVILAGVFSFYNTKNKNTPPISPVPLNHQSVQNAVVTYFFSGRIEKIASDSSSPKSKKLILVSDNGTRFPQTVIMSDSAIVYNTNAKGEIADKITTKELKEGIAVSIDILYNAKTSQFIPSIIRLKSK